MNHGQPWQPMNLPVIIQGGMGVAVSDWRLARAVSAQGQLGVVSGTALAAILARRLQQGDPDGGMRRALAHFPIPGVADRLLAAHFVDGGKPADKSFALSPMPALTMGDAALELLVAANFVEVFLAKEGHGGLVGINFLEKIQFPLLASMYGAMLAGVDFVLIGAGIPRSIPGMLDGLARGEAVKMKIDVEGAGPDEEFHSTFDPMAFCKAPPPSLKRPHFLAIIGSATLAMTLAKKSNGRVDGFIVEGEKAGGHNAPPRGPMQLTPEGEPLYGPRDVPQLDKIRELGLPFWLAGTYGRPGRLAEAREAGAAGIQVGTAFAFCRESGIREDIKRRAIASSRAGKASVFTDPLASPTSFPFKVAQVEGSISDRRIYESRPRICDLGFLRKAYRKAPGVVGYRCPAEPVDAYVSKGGKPEDTAGRKCICNGLFATVGHAQVRGAYTEPPLVTAGNDFATIAQFAPDGQDSYTAADVIKVLLKS
jgi:nitronate monooxygenase